MLNRFIVLVTAILLAGCVNLGGKNVFFGERIQQAGPPQDKVMEVYFDRVGDLYPDRTVVIEDLRMKKTLTLRQYFMSINPTCMRHNNSPVANQMCSIGARQDPAAIAQWNAIQDRQFAVTAKLLADKLRDTKAPLVVLIHGFRVENADRIYAVVRKRMDDYLAGRQKPVYLLVHWDGLTSPTPFGVWGEAQVNGYLVGLALRRVLADVAPETPLRVMTHSSGGFVLSATLGDPAAVFQADTFNSQEFSDFRANATGTPRYPLPRSNDIRAALIVPATPAWSYAGGRGPTGGTHPGMLSPAKLIVGLNEKDVGVSKGPVNGNWSIFGSTDLGQNVNAFCQLRSAFASRAQERRPPVPALVDFEGSQPRVRAALFWDSHDWKHYMERDKMTSVFGLLFGTGAPGGEGEAPCQQ